MISVLTKNTTVLTEHLLANLCHALSQYGVTELSLSDQELMYCPRKTTDPKLHKCKEMKVRSMKNYTTERFMEVLKGIDFRTESCINITYQDLIAKFIDAVGSR